MKHLLLFVLIIVVSSCYKEEMSKTNIRIINNSYCTYEIFGNGKSWDTLPPGFYQEFNPPIGTYEIKAIKVEGTVSGCKSELKRTVQANVDTIIEWKI